MILGNGHPFASDDVVVYDRRAWSSPLPDGDPHGEPVARARRDRATGSLKIKRLPAGEYVALEPGNPARVRFVVSAETTE